MNRFWRRFVDVMHPVMAIIAVVLGLSFCVALALSFSSR